jgi:meso-butanediol dehydrogenase / (S,S)-butanediol dehydrogenase / diacetyl reductase
MINFSSRFLGKVAIITGAGRGIGAGIAMRLAQEGARVIIADIDADAAASAAQITEDAGELATAYVVDIADASAVRTMVASVTSQFGHIDILVNNAGVNNKTDLLELDEEEWQWLMNINMKGLFFTMQAVAKQMIAQIPVAALAEGRAAHGFGKIVNLSSVTGRRGRANAPHYAASKAAVISLTQSAAQRLAPFNINVNAICPGIVWTPLWEQLDRAETAKQGLPSGSYFKARVEEKVPLRRGATLADIAGVVAFLCSAEADYITGQALNVDGGYEMN